MNRYKFSSGEPLKHHKFPLTAAEKIAHVARRQALMSPPTAEMRRREDALNAALTNEDALRRIGNNLAGPIRRDLNF
jgi:hypothetical protein